MNHLYQLEETSSGMEFTILFTKVRFVQWMPRDGDWRASIFWSDGSPETHLFFTAEQKAEFQKGLNLYLSQEGQDAKLGQ